MITARTLFGALIGLVSIAAAGFAGFYIVFSRMGAERPPLASVHDGLSLLTTAAALCLGLAAAAGVMRGDWARVGKVSAAFFALTVIAATAQVSVFYLGAREQRDRDLIAAEPITSAEVLPLRDDAEAAVPVPVAAETPARVDAAGSFDAVREWARDRAVLERVLTEEGYKAIPSRNRDPQFEELVDAPLLVTISTAIDEHFDEVLPRYPEWRQSADFAQARGAPDGPPIGWAFIGARPAAAPANSDNSRSDPELYLRIVLPGERLILDIEFTGRSPCFQYPQFYAFDSALEGQWIRVTRDGERPIWIPSGAFGERKFFTIDAEARDEAVRSASFVMSTTDQALFSAPTRLSEIVGVPEQGFMTPTGNQAGEFLEVRWRVLAAPEDRHVPGRCLFISNPLDEPLPALKTDEKAWLQIRNGEARWYDYDDAGCGCD